MSDPAPDANPDGAPEPVVPGSFQVVDDEQDDTPALEWVAGELLAGRSFEAVTSDLVAAGHPPAAAERFAEQARRQTRAERGVVTRDDVARGAERRYRYALASSRWIAFGGLPAFLVGVRNLLVSVRAIRSGRRRRE